MVAKGSGKAAKKEKSKQSQTQEETDTNWENEDPHSGLLTQKSSRRKRQQFDALSASWTKPNNSQEWQRPYWLGSSLCLILFAFWMLDSLKDPIFGDLANGNLKRHQPIAKLVSVATTLALVLFLEHLSNAKKEWQRQVASKLQQSNESVLDAARAFWVISR